MPGPAWILLVTSILIWDGIPGRGPDPTPTQSCCPRKRVGDIFYSLLGRSRSALNEGCKNDCTYRMEEFPYTAVCFGQGVLPVKCFQQISTVASVSQAEEIIASGKAAMSKLVEVKAKLQVMLNTKRKYRAASDIPQSCTSFISKIDDLKTASDKENMKEVLTIATALVNTPSSVSCSASEKAKLRAKVNKIDAVTQKVSYVIKQAEQFLKINFATKTVNEKLEDNNIKIEALKELKTKTDSDIADGIESSQYVSTAFDSLQSWFFCFFSGHSEEDHCNPSTDVTTSPEGTTNTDTTPKEQTTTTSTVETSVINNNLDKIQTEITGASAVKMNVELGIAEAENKTNVLKNFKATIFTLNNIFFNLISRNIQSSTTLAIAAHLSSTHATEIVGEGERSFEDINNPFRISCEELLASFKNITMLLENNPIQALAMANDLKKQFTSYNVNCTANQTDMMRREMFLADNRASEIVKEETTKVKAWSEKLTSAFNSIIEANDDLINLVPDERSQFVVEFYDQVVTTGNESIDVTCCTHDNQRINVTCGLGKSCTSRCKALDSLLCPTMNCTDNFQDCIPSFEEEGQQKKRGKFSSANLPSWVFTKCKRRHVWRKPKCCFKPSIMKKNIRGCKWMKNYSGTKCRSPGHPPNGRWSCFLNDIPLPGPEAEDGLINYYQANTCQLRCDPGFSSNIAETVTCVEGKYKPTSPEDFLCEPAAALIVTDKGEIEIFSEQANCRRKITNVPPFSAAGQIVTLLNNKLQLLGFYEQEQIWKSSSMEDPFGGILANKWTENQQLSEDKLDSYDISYNYFNDVYFSGGNAQRQAKLEAGKWIHFNEKIFEDSKFTSAACVVALENNQMMFFGGLSFKSTNAVNLVVTINVEEQSVRVNPGMKYPRCHHSCELITGSTVLISGGFNNPKEPGGSLVPDEIYDTRTGESMEVASFLGRYDHSVIHLEDSIFAFGGRDAKGSQVSAVDKFDSSSRTWSRQTQVLFSLETAGLAVVPFPMSAVDCSTCTCGVKRSKRIYGGEEVKAHDFPWILALLVDGDIHFSRNYQPSFINSQCSATLIGSNWAVTASHCVYNLELEEVRPAASLSVLPGLHDRSKPSLAVRHKVQVREVHIHDKFDIKASMEHDIALLKLDSRVDLSTFPPVCLPTQGQIFLDRNAFVYGWGETGKSHMQNTLHAAQVPIVACDTNMGQTVWAGKLCAGGQGPGSCPGDSGGPLTVEEDGQHTLAGVVSGGNSTCGQKGPLQDVYAEVANYVGWINRTILANGGMSSCGHTIAADRTTNMASSTIKAITATRASTIGQISFTAISQTISTAITGQCEDDQFKCGSQCIQNYQSSTFWACGDSCIRTSKQCDGRCHADRSPCGDTDCKSPSYRDQYWECGEHCIEKGEPCDCFCPPQRFLCRDQCQPDTSTAWWMCGEECLSTSRACEGVCKHGYFLCGSECKEDTENNREYYRTCGNECISEDEQCKGSCPAHKSVPCGDTTCYPQEYDYDLRYRTCGADCIREEKQCNGSCPLHRSVPCGKTTCHKKDEAQSERTCGDLCLSNDVTCNRTCPKNLLPCGEKCVTDTSSSQCDSTCSAGTLKCGMENGCRVNSAFNWERCGDACFNFNPETGALSTAQYPLPYLTNQNCVLNISAPEGYHVLVKNYESEIYRGDNLWFYEILSTEDQSRIPVPPFISAHNHINLRFITGNYNIKERGLNATVSFIKIHQCETKGPCSLICPPGFIPCNNHCMLNTSTSTCPESCLSFDTSTMILSSRNFPGFYPLMEDCSITIYSGNKNLAVHLNFHTFYTARSYDKVTFFDGRQIAPQALISERSGYDQTSPVLSTGSSMTILFSARYARQYKGFNATVSYINVTSLNCPVGLTACGNYCKPSETVCTNQCPYDQEAKQFWTCDENCIETDQQCNGSCPPDHFICGKTCRRNTRTNWDKWYSCGELCLEKHQQCEGGCPENSFTCGKVCKKKSSSNLNYYRSCGDQCLENNQKCDGECPENYYVCGNECKQNTSHNLERYRNCGGQCIGQNTPCGNKCQDGYRECYGQCINQNTPCHDQCIPGFHKCCNLDYRSSCQNLTSPSSSYWDCNGVCISRSSQCNNSCHETLFKCGKTCLQKTASNMKEYRTCGEECIKEDKQCQGNCPSHRNLTCGEDRCYPDIFDYQDGYQTCKGVCIESWKQCKNTCPEGRFQCGGLCKEKTTNNIKQYRTCGSQCITSDQQCNNTCAEDRFACGDTCKESKHNFLYRNCGSKCISHHQQCDGNCPAHRNLSCGEDRCLPNTSYYQENYQMCGADCISSSQQCEKVCPEGWFQCGSVCKQNTTYNQENYWSCGSDCIPGSQQCDGSCPAKRLVCGSLCKKNTPQNIRQWRSCGSQCISDSYQCDGECPAHNSWACGEEKCYPGTLNTLTNFKTCGSECTSASRQCNGSCSSGWFVCGNLCMQITTQNLQYWRSCGFQCMSESYQCDGECPAHRNIACGKDRCYPDTLDYKTCGSDCISTTWQCNGTCTKEFFKCGTKVCKKDTTSNRNNYRTCRNDCIQNNKQCKGTCPESFFPCGSTECLTNSTYNQEKRRTCGDECIWDSNPCNGKCGEGHILCGVNTCVSQTSREMWSCGESCIRQSSPCLGECPPNKLASQDGQACVDQAEE